MRIVTIGWSEPVLATVLQGKGLDVAMWPWSPGLDWSATLRGQDTVILRAGGLGAAAPDAVSAMLAAAIDLGLRRLIYVGDLGHDLETLGPAALAQAEVQAADLDWTVLLMAPCFGGAEDLLRMLGQALRLSPVAPLARDMWRVQPLSVYDSVAAVVAALEDPLTIGGVYEVAGPEILNLPELASRVLAAVGRRRGALTLPAGLARRGWAGLAWAGGVPGLTWAMAVDRVAHDNRAELLLARPPERAAGANLAYLRT